MQNDNFSNSQTNFRIRLERSPTVFLTEALSQMHFRVLRAVWEFKILNWEMRRQRWAQGPS